MFTTMIKKQDKETGYLMSNKNQINVFTTRIMEVLTPPMYQIFGTALLYESFNT